MNERGIIDLLAGMSCGNSPNLVCGIGDDCAVINKDGGTSWLVTMDTLVESVHFDLHWHPSYLLGRKSVAVNVSDIAAMGGEPLFIFLSLGLPSGYDEQWLAGFSQGVADACAEYGCILAGGDTVRSTSGVLITITAIGEVAVDDAVFRNGAKVGDTVWVSGALGKAAAGLELCRAGKAEDVLFKDLIAAHLDPQPRLKLGAQLAKKNLARSMMDLSDGIATDLAHLCEQSGVGAVIDPDKLPAASTLNEAAQLLELDKYQLMISGGEDYELIFTASGKNADALEDLAADTGVSLTRIGIIDAKKGVRAVSRSASGKYLRETDISFSGFDHFDNEMPSHKIFEK